MTSRSIKERIPRSFESPFSGKHNDGRSPSPWGQQGWQTMIFPEKGSTHVDCRYLCYDKLEGTSSWSVNITFQHPDFWYLQDFVLQVLAAGHITMLFRSIGVPNNTTIPHRFPLRTRITLGRFQGDFAHGFWTAEWVYRKHSECGFSQDFLWYEPTQRHGDRRPQLPSNFIEHFPLKSLQVPWNPLIGRSISILSTSDSYCEKYDEICDKWPSDYPKNGSRLFWLLLQGRYWECRVHGLRGVGGSPRWNQRGVRHSFCMGS